MIRTATGAMTHEQPDRTLIGFVLCRPSETRRILDGIPDASVFDDVLVRETFLAARAVHDAGKEPTETYIAAELKRRGVAFKPGEFAALTTDCVDRYYTNIAPIEEHVKALRDRGFTQRLKTRIASLDDADEIEQVALEEIARRTSARDGGPVPLGDVMREVAERQHKIAAGTLAVGYTTGLDALDEHVQIRAGDAHAIIARTGIGKSAYLLHLVSANESNPGLPVDGLMFSLEMARDAVAKRKLGYEANINTRFVDSRYAGPNLRADLDRVAAECADVRIEVDGSADLTVAEIIARAKHWKRRRKVRDGIVAVDFAQLVRRERNRDENGAEAFQRVAYGLRGFAQTEGLAVVVTAQTNRVGSLAGIPQLEHVEGGGGLGRACAVVLGLHLPETTQRPKDVQRLEVHVLKNRHGQAGQVVPVTVDFSTGRFS